jgi:hypothetical protein
MRATLVPHGSRTVDPKPNYSPPILCVPAISSREERTRMRHPPGVVFETASRYLLRCR